MGAAEPNRPLATPSALQNLLASHPSPKDSSPIAAEQYRLALQIAHNLRYQHSWTAIRLHTTSTGSKSSSDPSSSFPKPLPRPLISGIPPQRLYVHPDEQIALLQQHKDQGHPGAPTPPAPEREWVLPSHLREKWSLRRFGETFDAIDVAPIDQSGEALFEDGKPDGEHEGISKGEEGAEKDGERRNMGEWRLKSPKRLLLATLDDDSTVVYYIVHDGIVKPRQN